MENEDFNHTILRVRQKQRPGPPSSDSMKPAEVDLCDAAKILSLVEKGMLNTEAPQRDKSKDRIILQGRERLSQEDESLLAKRIQMYGDLDARNCLVMANLGLVHLVANQYVRPSIRYEDLVQEGTMGLMRATETFEPDRGVRFSTYGVYWIRAKIQRLLQKIEKDDMPTITGAKAEEDQDGRLKKPKARKISMDRGVFEDDENRNLQEILASDTKTPESIALDVEKKKVIRDILYDIALELKDERLHTIIKHRLLCEEPKTLTVVGKKLNLSREGARLLEAKLLKIAKHRLKKWQKSKEA